MSAPAKPAAGPEAVCAIAEAGGEPDWLRRWRLSAWESYAATPLPDRVAHLWRYTEPEKFVPDRVRPLLPKADAAATGRPAGPDAGLAGAVLRQDAGAATGTLDARLRDAGVVLTDLATAVREHGELVREHLGKAVPVGHGKFAGLNAALFAGGAFLYVPPGVEVEAPFHTLFRTSEDLSAVFPRSLLIVEDGAAVTVIDELAVAPEALADGAAPRVIAHAVVEGYVGRNARLQYVNVQHWGSRTRSHLTERIHAHRDAQVITIAVALGGLYNKADLGTVLQGANAQSEMIGVLFGDGRQHFDHHTEHVHAVGNTFSDLDFKVVLEGRSRSAYTGLIRIELDALHSEAYQENRNLLLDPDCRAESIPELEILNDEVRCTHGATIGPIDEEQLFYLMSRGLPRRQAERTIVEGFFEPALARIADDSLRQRLWNYVGAKLAAR